MWLALQSFARCLAGLYGVKATAQGGSSSGRTALVLQATATTAAPFDLPDADDEQNAAGSGSSRRRQLIALLTQELTAELTAAAIATDSVMPAMKR
jgi:hypothetical protein